MKTQEIVDVRVGESTQPDYGYELSDRCIITKSSKCVEKGFRNAESADDHQSLRMLIRSRKQRFV